MTTPIIDAADATDTDCVGGKAAALSALVKAGFKVPGFFVLTARSVAIANGDDAEKRALNRQIKAHLPDIGPGPFAVRSSGRSEDGAEHSHAGQFDTELNVKANAVMSAALRVWASGFAETVATYRGLKTGEGAEAPAVLIQQMVPAHAAGVAFSADPVSGKRNVTVISAVRGLGEALVSGAVDGEDWRVEDNGTATMTGGHADVLSESQALEIAELARRAEIAFGCPQDIEWAIADDALYLLQSRAITTALRTPANPDDAMMVFDNSNIVESYPGLVTPLTYSFADYSYNRVYRAFVALLGVSQEEISANATVFGNLLARIDGRVYYNLGNWYRALALLPGFSLNRGYMETMMGVDEPLPSALTETIGPPPSKGLAKLGDYLKLARVGFGLIRQARRLKRTKSDFMRRLNAALTEGPDLDTANLTELTAEYRKIESALLDQWDAPLVNDFLCMIGFGASRAMLEKWAGQAGIEFHNDFMIGQGDIVSAEPAQRIAELSHLIWQNDAQDDLHTHGLAGLDDLPKITARFEEYLAKFGDRCTEELKLESIPLTEDPSQLIAAVLAGADRPQTERAEKPEPDWNAVLRNPLKRILAKPLTNWARNRVRDRENLRFERTRIFGHARRLFLAMGRELEALGKINARRDVFFLTVPELLGVTEGNALSQDLQSLIELRRAEMAASEGRPDPDARIIVHGAAINLPAVSQSVSEVEDATRIVATGCSAGQVTAKARVIRDPRKESLTPGDILVARNTDPGWIAVFANASAIVVERGSLLSHSAIVARELGIPCVVGLKDATRWIPDGATLSVNGATGEVEIMND